MQPGGNQPIAEPNGREPDFSEDDRQREQLGPAGGDKQRPGEAMTPQRRKKTPANNDPGHTA